MELTCGHWREGKCEYKREKEPMEKGVSPGPEVLKRENNKSTKLLGRGLKTGFTHVAPEEGLVRQVRKVLLDMSGSSSCKLP